MEILVTQFPDTLEMLHSIYLLLLINRISTCKSLIFSLAAYSSGHWVITFWRNFGWAHGWARARYAQAKLNNDFFRSKFCLWSQKSGQISNQKFFFVIFHEISKYRKIFKCDLKKWTFLKFLDITQSKEEAILFQMVKKWRGRGGSGHFSILKDHGILWVSRIIAIFCIKILVYY